MSIFKIVIMGVMALAAGLFKKGRGLFLLAISGFMVFWLQPHFGNATVTYLVPTATIFIVILSWAATSSLEVRSWKKNYPAILILIGIALLFWLNRFLKIESLFDISTPSLMIVIGLWIVLLGGLFIVIKLLQWQRVLLVLFAIAILFALLVVKSDFIATFIREVINKLIHRESPAIIFSFQWFGFSYIAFRILHTIFEKKAGRLPEVTLAEYMNYVIFFPALPAGPIDRLERFLGELREPRPLNNEGLFESGKRLLIGLFKKFVVADGLALLSIDKVYTYVKSPLWLWFLIYLYGFRIYFDFSGYTDIAIGLGRLIGIQLPENFEKPYLKPNITLFWNSWHITLTQWFRSYIFNPLVRKFKLARYRLPDFITLFIAQMTTMLLIGLWHGVNINFLLWGAWHGLGLFIHNRWSNWRKTRSDGKPPSKFMKELGKTVGIIITFNFVAIGWVFFIFPTLGESIIVLSRMFGLG